MFRLFPGTPLSYSRGKDRVGCLTQGRCNFAVLPRYKSVAVVLTACSIPSSYIGKGYPEQKYKLRFLTEGPSVPFAAVNPD